MTDAEVLRTPLLGAMPHGFLGRRGGVSDGVHAGLNVGFGSDDDPARVSANRAIAAEAVLPGATLVTVHQVHSATVMRVDAPIPVESRPPADALVTATPGLLIGVLTADCVPVLLADAEAGVVGAAHAGWKGALAGVTDATVAAMAALGAAPERIVAAIGPCIGRASYEVTTGFADPFLAQDGDNARFFAAGRPGHLMFDIAGYVAARLASAGLARITLLDEDTYGQPERFFSYRRSCHRSEPDYGRQISLIGLHARGHVR
jgi:hypothetical protein